MLAYPTDSTTQHSPEMASLTRSRSHARIRVAALTCLSSDFITTLMLARPIGSTLVTNAQPVPYSWVDGGNQCESEISLVPLSDRIAA